MKTLIRSLLVGLALLAPSAALADGPEIFRSQNCTSCHSITKAGISRSATPDEKAKDLSDIGTRHDKKFIAGFLLKKQEIDGEKHKKGFAGTTEELKVLATWLETLK
ncbi:MAG TPA: c-type cytochrome [Myxococcota bacterium]|nr:c-type cytochrome [Myxococcota bacterium]